METKEIIVNNLTIQTLQSARRFYIKSGEPAESLTIDRVKKLVAEHFDLLLDTHFNDSFSRGDIDFEAEKQSLFAKLPPMDLNARENLASDLWGLFGRGFLNGYLMGVKDAETILNTLNDERTEHEQTGSDGNITQLDVGKEKGSV